MTALERWQAYYKTIAVEDVQKASNVMLGALLADVSPEDVDLYLKVVKSVIEKGE